MAFFNDDLPLFGIKSFFSSPLFFRNSLSSIIQRTKSKDPGTDPDAVSEADVANMKLIVDELIKLTLHQRRCPEKKPKIIFDEKGVYRRLST